MAALEPEVYGQKVAELAAWWDIIEADQAQKQDPVLKNELTTEEVKQD